MSKNAVLVAAGILILIVGGWFLMRPKQTSTVIPQADVATDPSTESNAVTTDGATVEETGNGVTITTNSYSPKDITIKVGESVTWTNSDSIVHTVNSAVHPTHQVYPPLNLDNIQPGDKKSLVFPTAGVYKYHDHLNPSLTGQVTVE